MLQIKEHVNEDQQDDHQQRQDRNSTKIVTDDGNLRSPSGDQIRSESQPQLENTEDCVPGNKQGGEETKDGTPAREPQFQFQTAEQLEIVPGEQSDKESLKDIVSQRSEHTG